MAYVEQKMTTKRKRHTAQFKFKVALEAVGNQKTRSQIASEYEVHPTQISQWKKTLTQKGSNLFNNRPKQHEKQLAAQEIALYEQIGRLKMELEWLKKKVAQASL